VAFTQSVKDFTSRVIADLGLHPAPPVAGKILVRQQNIFGKKNVESMRKGILIGADHK
jgi:hypothetical protein